MVGRIRAVGDCVRVGGNCLKYLKRGWNRKKSRGHKDFKNGSKLGQGVGALKRGRPEPPYELWGVIRTKVKVGHRVWNQKLSNSKKL